MKRDLPNVHFGSPENKPLDWRKMPDTEGPDDDELRPPAKSTVKLLKVNPLKIFTPKKNHDQFHEESSIPKIKTIRTKASVRHYIGPKSTPHATIDTEEWPNGHFIQSLRTHKDYRGRGYASLLLKHIIAKSNISNNPIYLNAKSDLPQNKNRLEGFYKKHGFKKVKPNADFNMIYKPKKNPGQLHEESSKEICVDTAYLTPAYWSKWDSKLRKVEKQLGIKRLRVDRTFNEKYKVNEYKIWYENPGIKLKRQLKGEIRMLWRNFENPMSMQFK